MDAVAAAAQQDSHPAPSPGANWDIFCRVVDNYGDAGIAWRLAVGLAARGIAVRLWIDDAAPLRFIAPHGAPGVRLCDWAKAERHDADDGDAVPGAVVIETFGCEAPAAFMQRGLAACVAACGPTGGADASGRANTAARAAQAMPPLLINLEHLSAEPFVERSHGLPSPLSAAQGGGTRWFYFPGFSPATGGLLREPALLQERAAFDRHAWLAAHGLALQRGERCAVLFCYADAPLAPLLDRLDAAGGHWLVLAAAGASQAAVMQALATTRRPRLRAAALPLLPQPQFDRLLWCADFACVRGEDSVLRALWAGVPFLWHIYPQHDGAHAAKLEAFMDRMLDGADAPLAAAVRRLWRAWNGLGDWPAAGPLPDMTGWRAQVQRWRDALAAQPDLVSRLLEFVAQRR